MRNEALEKATAVVEYTAIVEGLSKKMHELKSKRILARENLQKAKEDLQKYIRMHSRTYGSSFPPVALRISTGEIITVHPNQGVRILTEVLE